jgi:hypothetical protein
MLPFPTLSAMAILAFVSISSNKDPISQLHGEYRDIKVSTQTEAITTFLDGTNHDKERLALRIQASPSRYAPAVFFHLAVYLFQQDDVEEALFWLYCGRIRTYFDIQRCTDQSVAGAAEILNNLVPPLLRLEQFIDLENSKRIMERAVEWDRETPHDYDARWIAFHGIGASLPEPAPGMATPLTIPEDQWDALAEKHRTEYFAQWMSDVSSISEEQLTLILAKYDELRAAEETPGDDDSADVDEETEDEALEAPTEY